ncbi:MAG: GNAT family N-acetyltransferase [Draconibacterium sp.]|nr:GNAT family N-acetyltransferase [Draconibacterium sp.]
MNIEVREITTKSDLRKFISFYTKLYNNCEYSPIPLHFDELETLLEDKNPAFKNCKAQYWMAYKNGKPVGRIAAIVKDNELSTTNKPIGRFGWFDFIDDKEVSEALMRTALEWIKEQGRIMVHGPFGFTDMDRQGMLIEGFDRMGTFATPYNYSYYPEHMEAMGFSKSIDWVEFEIDVENLLVERVEKIAKYAAIKHEFRLVKITKRKQLYKYVPAAFDILNNEYAHLYGFTQLSEEQINHYVKMFINLVSIDFISFVVDKDDKLIGFGVTMPSFSEASIKAKGKLLPFGWYHFWQAMKKNHTLDLYLVAVSSEYQKKGVSALLITHTARKAKEFGILRAETNIELESNNSVQSMWQFFERNQHKRRRCYIKDI